MTERWYTTAELAAEFGLNKKTLLKKVKAANLQVIDAEGRAGFRYSEADRLKLIDHMRPAAPTQPTRKRRRAA